MSALAYTIEHDNGQAETVHVVGDNSKTIFFIGLCIALTCDALDNLGCHRNGDQQIFTVMPSLPGSRVERPLTIDGPAVNGGAT